MGVCMCVCACVLLSLVVSTCKHEMDERASEPVSQ